MNFATELHNNYDLFHSSSFSDRISPTDKENRGASDIISHPHTLSCRFLQFKSLFFGAITRFLSL